MNALITLLTVLTFSSEGELTSVETVVFNDQETCTAFAASLNKRMQLRNIDPNTYDITCTTH